MGLILFGLLVFIALSNALFHVYENKVGDVKNPFFVLTNTYVIVVAVLLAITLINGVTFEQIVEAINWPIIIVALSGVGFNFFIILCYRYGAKVSTLFDIVTPIAAISVIAIGILFFSENFTVVNGVGVLISLVGVYLISTAEEEQEKTIEKMEGDNHE